MFEPTMRNAVTVRRALQDEFLHAIATVEFTLHYSRRFTSIKAR